MRYRFTMKANRVTEERAVEADSVSDAAWKAAREWREKPTFRQAATVQTDKGPMLRYVFGGPRMGDKATVEFHPSCTS